MTERENEMQVRLETLREITDRLGGDLDENEAVDLLEQAVDEVERFGKKLEEAGS